MIILFVFDKCILSLFSTEINLEMSLKFVFYNVTLSPLATESIIVEQKIV